MNVTDQQLLDANQHALASGGWAKVHDLADQLDRQRSTGPTLGEAALWYVSVGLPVFPLSPGSKIPWRGSAGCKDATLDPDRVRAWWTRTPDANIGLATGHLIDVVDVDGATGQSSRAREWFCSVHARTAEQLADQTLPVDPMCDRCVFAKVDSLTVAKVVTPSPQGMHLYVPVQGDGNRAGVYPGIDYRGAGGYVVAPPSRTEKGSYRFIGTPRLDQLNGVIPRGA